MSALLAVIALIYFGIIRRAAEKAGELGDAHLGHIFHLGIKELLSLARDPVLLSLIVYRFTFSVYTPSKSAVMDVINASVAVVDEDDSEAARRDPRCAVAAAVSARRQRYRSAEINRAMDEGRYTFVVDIPPKVPSRSPAKRRRTYRRDHHRRDGDEPGRRGPAYIIQQNHHPEV